MRAADLGRLGAETPAGRYRGGIDATACPRPLVPEGTSRRDEILAVCVVLAIGAHLLFAQLTFVFAVLLQLTTKVTRWRLSWLAIPAAAGSGLGRAGPRAAWPATPGAVRVVGYLGERALAAHLSAHYPGVADSGPGCRGKAPVAVWQARWRPLAGWRAASSDESAAPARPA